jgi:hypothetical protein
VIFLRGEGGGGKLSINSEELAVNSEELAVNSEQLALTKGGSASIINRQNFEVYDELFRRGSPSLQRFLLLQKRFSATPTH